MPNSQDGAGETSRHVCSDCGRSYKAAETLNRHRKNHSDTTKYDCDLCDSSFKRKDLLDRHANIHASGRLSFSRNRSQRACDRCSRLKTRCDNLESCSRCTKGGHECTYKLKSSRARTDRSSTTSLESSMSSPRHDTGGSTTPNATPHQQHQPQLQQQQPPPQQPMIAMNRLWSEDEVWLIDQWQWPATETGFPSQYEHSLSPTVRATNSEVQGLPNWYSELNSGLVADSSMLSSSQAFEPSPSSPRSGRLDSVWTNSSGMSYSSNGLDILSEAMSLSGSHPPSHPHSHPESHPHSRPPSHPRSQSQPYPQSRPQSSRDRCGHEVQQGGSLGGFQGNMAAG